MEPLSLAEIRPPAAYEPARAEARREVVERRRPRRVALGDLLSVVFENRETVRGVVEELLRAERIEEPDRIVAELEAFNALLPGAGELAATLFVEVTDAAELTTTLDRLRGIEGCLSLEVGGRPARARDAGGGTGPARPASVHFLRFRLDPEQRAALGKGAEVALVADHEDYAARTVLDEAQRAALAEDLTVAG